MQLNPILALELRARWRMNRSHLLLLGVALALSFLAAFVYQSAGLRNDSDAAMVSALNPSAALQSFNGGASSVGRQLFMALAHANILSWLLLSVASAATGIARERERGLLESLQLSRMSAPGQIRARFFANVLLLSLLQLVLLPVYGVAMMMGGVSLPEVAGAIYLATCSAILGTSIGLWFSARSHRPTNALFGSLGTIALLSGGLFYWMQGTLWGAMYGGGGNWDSLAPVLLHPSGLFWALTDPMPRWNWSAPEMVATTGALWALSSLLLLMLAARNVNRTLPVAAWRTGSVWVEKLKQKQAVAPPKSVRAQRTNDALLADIPLDRFVKFSDPLLSREVKARFRLRRAGFWLSIVRGGLFLGATTAWLFEVFWLFDPPSRDLMAPSGLLMLLYGGTLCLAVLAATSWTRERESGTWESLKLSLLTPRQILRAKWLSPLISFAYYAAPLLILMPIGALFIDFKSFLVGIVVVAAWLGLAVALGLWMSWRVRNGTAAIAWTVGVLAMLLLGVPWLNSLAGVDDTLAGWKYGIGNPAETYNAIYRTPPANGAALPRFAQIYEKQTGDKATEQSFNPSGMAMGSYYTPNLQNWVREKLGETDTFKRGLRVWHPGEALDRLFKKGGTNYNSSYPYYGNYETRFDMAAETTSAVWWSILSPLALTMILLLLLRRDVKQEQLNA